MAKIGPMVAEQSETLRQESHFVLSQKPPEQNLDGLEADFSSCVASNKIWAR